MRDGGPVGVHRPDPPIRVGTRAVVANIATFMPQFILIEKQSRPLALMHPAARSALWFASVTLSTLAHAADKPPATPPQADAALEIHSYGEPAADLRELLAPFLGGLSFAETRRLPTSSERYVASEFRSPEGDRVITLGGPNCLVVGYFAALEPLIPLHLTPADRAGRFAAQLKDFLEGLPAPRPRAHETRWSRESWCRR